MYNNKCDSHSKKKKKTTQTTKKINQLNRLRRTFYYTRTFNIKKNYKKYKIEYCIFVQVFSTSYVTDKRRTTFILLSLNANQRIGTVQ